LKKLPNRIFTAATLLAVMVVFTNPARAVDCYDQLETDMASCTIYNTGVSVVLRPLCYSAAYGAFNACTANKIALGIGNS